LPLINLVLAGIDSFFDPNISLLKKLLSFFAGSSALAQIGPVYFHIHLLS
jgi:hypothetical protein